MHFRFGDVRAAAQLAVRATSGVIDIVEGVHHAVLRTLGAASKESARVGGVTGLVYKAIRGTTELVGLGLQHTLTSLEPRLPAPQGEQSSARLAVLAALNGVLGDQLHATSNPLATPMSLFIRGAELQLHELPALAGGSGKLMLLIHGLCMHEQHWGWAEDGTRSHADALVDAFGYLPIGLRYNSGRAIAHNGAELAALLDQLIERWPVPVTELSVLTHSMGGLLIRSAVAQAAPGSAWRRCLRKIVFLGTPHHGAPLERAGNGIDALLASTPWSAPFARLGQVRSAGITDLRHGNVLDHYSSERERFAQRHDVRQIVPLPTGVDCYTIAATLAQDGCSRSARLLGDGLVPLQSGLGMHDDPQHALSFAPHAQRVLHGVGHLQLLKDPNVTRAVLDWMR